MNDSFKKFDGKKNRLELIQPDFIEGLGRILSFGAEKYDTNNWMLANSDEDQERIQGALLRHIFAYMKGEKIDQETGESHLYHATCNLMFLDYFDRNESSSCFVNLKKDHEMVEIDEILETSPYELIDWVIGEYFTIAKIGKTQPYDRFTFQTLSEFKEWFYKIV